MSKRVVITGATDGIGKQLAIILNEKGYELSLCGRSEQKMQDLLQQLDNKNVYQQCFDMKDETSLKNFCQNVLKKGNVDILINNAGFNPKKSSVLDLDISDVRDMMEVNFISHILMIQQFLPSMLQRRDGQIINILSSCCLFNNPSVAGYTASKNAMKSINDVLAKEVKDKGVRVFGVYPGGIDTAFRENSRPDYMSAKTVAKAIVATLDIPKDAFIQELVLRPPCEDNY